MKFRDIYDVNRAGMALRLVSAIFVQFIIFQPRVFLNAQFADSDFNDTVRKWVIVALYCAITLVIIILFTATFVTVYSAKRHQSGEKPKKKAERPSVVVSEEATKKKKASEDQARMDKYQPEQESYPEERKQDTVINIIHEGSSVHDQETGNLESFSQGAMEAPPPKKKKEAPKGKKKKSFERKISLTPPPPPPPPPPRKAEEKPLSVFNILVPKEESERHSDRGDADSVVSTQESDAVVVKLTPTASTSSAGRESKHSGSTVQGGVTHIEVRRPSFSTDVDTAKPSKGTKQKYSEPPEKEHTSWLRSFSRGKPPERPEKTAEEDDINKPVAGRSTFMDMIRNSPCGVCLRHATYIDPKGWRSRAAASEDNWNPMAEMVSQEQESYSMSQVSQPSLVEKGSDFDDDVSSSSGTSEGDEEEEEEEEGEGGPGKTNVKVVVKMKGAEETKGDDKGEKGKEEKGKEEKGKGEKGKGEKRPSDASDDTEGDDEDAETGIE